MGSWPFGARGGLTVKPLTSDDPLICAHQAVQLKLMLDEFDGRYEETLMVLDRLEIVYHCAGRSEDAARVHSDKLALLLAPGSKAREYQGIFGRFGEYLHLVKQESRYRRGLGAIDHRLAELHRRAPWTSQQDEDAVRDPA